MEALCIASHTPCKTNDPEHVQFVHVITSFNLTTSILKISHLVIITIIIIETSFLALESLN